MTRRLWAAVVVAHLADVWSTAVALGMGGYESSPAAAGALGGAGVLGLALLKAAGLAAIAGVWAVSRRWWPSLAWVVPMTASICGLIPATWNASQIVLYGGVL